MGADRTLLYFAYGSNMLRARLRAGDRAPAADLVAQAMLSRHRLTFHKRGRDGSGKCDAFHTEDPEERVHGVLYRISAPHKQQLDRIEGVGVGYDVAEVEVVDGSGRRYAAFTYLARKSHVDSSLVPFAWYHALVVAGARENDLPARYVAELLRVATREDPDPERDARERRLLPPPQQSS